MKLQNKNFFKKLNRDLNTGIDSYDGKILKLEHTGLFANHEAGRGPNLGEPVLLEFTTKIIEATSIHFQQHGTLLEIFYFSTVGHGRDYGTFIEVRKNGKNQTLTWVDRNQESTMAMLSRLEIKISDDDMPYLSDSRDIKEFLIKQGFTVLVCFDFTGRIRQKLPHHGMGCYLAPTYLKETKQGIELGWISSGTYNSLPNVLKVSKVKGLKTTRLCDLGVETSGYYDGHYKCEILTAQANAAKAFFKRKFKKVKGA
jgi:hypothetical protein